MRTQIALSNLSYNKVRTALSVAGVCLAIVLIFLQLGFLGAVKTTATLIYDKLQYDVMLRSPDYLHLCDARHIPRDRLAMVASLPEVEQVTPFHVMLNNWQNPRTFEGRAIIVMGAVPSQIPLNVPELQQQAGRLDLPERLLIDRKTKHTYGPRENGVFGDADIGVVTDLGGRRVQIAGHFELGTGLAANGAMLTSEQGFARVALYDANKRVSMGLIRLRRGVDPRQFADRLQQQLSAEIDVLTRDEVDKREIQRWVSDTPIGAIFKMGVALAFLVGAAIVYMVLSTDVTKHLSEYATLNAMGYSQRYLSRVIMQQALLLAVLAYLPAWAGAECLYRLTTWLANIPVSMTLPRLARVLLLALAMSAVSGFFALSKLRRADPAELF